MGVIMAKLTESKISYDPVKLQIVAQLFGKEKKGKQNALNTIISQSPTPHYEHLTSLVEAFSWEKQKPDT